ncbi:ribosomal RNA small subunit methyltransferase A [Candidatus Mycosynbacter amalyticus]|uniref:Ribosomal RNA small subunit methyltransferase A n=1 Tax=Candidatus Mycosynbacter amalyticus TaxID=2665156 RepID=A0A857MNC7_9BACT|nr:16S rRNA (adenine(1518)-N(6)/adenine(1519)-N(6))-dimethyltransferase RsmA [Candidatus Mycosynbacter amalyticus]QHN43082.1 ribosomal RNA small subunit methyltransferase A [Candidatus Mycosynbacter amalyticus]
MPTKKSLGQHWLHDRFVLDHIADEANVNMQDTVLEVGPGLGTLTSILLGRAEQVIAVEFDPDLARKLPGQFPGKNLEVVHSDILAYDTRDLPAGYKVVANVPYYITSKIIQKFMTEDNQPSVVTLLIQKEVAERVAARPGDMSILAVSAQLYADVSLGDVVPAELFTPPPKVDSQVVTLRTKQLTLPDGVDEKLLFRVVKAGFSAKRKKLRSSLSGGLGMAKDNVDTLLAGVDISPDERAESLSVEDWKRLAEAYRAAAS